MPTLSPEQLIIYLIGANLLTLLVYWQDKRRARQGAWRISEGTLLMFALLGGSPAAYWGMKKFRHKTSKKSFRIRFWLIVIVQLFALAYYGLHQLPDIPTNPAGEQHVSFNGQHLLIIPDAYRRCASATDCALVGEVCQMGWRPVNAKVKADIEAMVAHRNMAMNCVLGDSRQPRVDCVQGLCQNVPD